MKIFAHKVIIFNVDDFIHILYQFHLYSLIKLLVSYTKQSEDGQMQLSQTWDPESTPKDKFIYILL
jgi:hypothetical protein